MMESNWARELGQLLGIADLEADAAGEVALGIGQRRVSLVATGAGIELATAVGQVPPLERQSFLCGLLKRNGELLPDGYRFGVDPANAEVLLLATASDATAEALRASVEALVQRANALAADPLVPA